MKRLFIAVVLALLVLAAGCRTGGVKRVSTSGDEGVSVEIGSKDIKAMCRKFAGEILLNLIKGNGPCGGIRGDYYFHRLGRIHDLLQLGKLVGTAYRGDGLGVQKIGAQLICR